MQSNTSAGCAPITNHPPLDSITKPTVETEPAAFYLNRKAQTLRGWACFGNGPIKPIRINGRLAWPVAEIKALLGVTERAA